MPTWATNNCERCGAPIQQRATGRPRRYCGQACRQAQYLVTKVNRMALAATDHINPQAATTALEPATAGSPGRKLVLS